MTAPTDSPALWEDDALVEAVAKEIAFEAMQSGGYTRDLIDDFFARASRSWGVNQVVDKYRRMAIASLRALSPHLVRRTAWPDDVAPRPLMRESGVDLKTSEPLQVISDATGAPIVEVWGDNAQQIAGAIVAAVNGEG